MPSDFQIPAQISFCDRWSNGRPYVLCWPYRLLNNSYGTVLLAFGPDTTISKSTVIVVSRELRIQSCGGQT
jgi:hypothetical protein